VTGGEESASGRGLVPAGVLAFIAMAVDEIELRIIAIAVVNKDKVS
jgi:hypothetical protein